MIKTKKTLILIQILLLILCSVLAISRVDAQSGTGEFNISGGGSSGVSPGTPQQSPGPSYDGGYNAVGTKPSSVYDPTYTQIVRNSANCSCSPPSCIASHGIYNPSSLIKWNSYDLYNNPIYSEEKTIAGTQLGFNLYEEKSVEWYAGSQACYTCSCKHRQCDYYEEDLGNGYYDRWFNCYWVYYSTGGCYSAQWCYEMNRELAYNEAVAAVSTGESYSLTITDPNDSRCANLEKYGKQLEAEGVVCDDYKEVKAVHGKVSPKYENPVIKNYYYEMYGSCVNVKTGKVRYLESKCKSDNCCNENEYYIENEESEEIKHWHVFTPLNSKETEGYSLFLKGKTLQVPYTCTKMIELYPNEYTHYIVPRYGEFSGYKKRDIEMIKSQNGCYFEMKIDLPIKQLFYNEVKESNTKSEIIGFKFYYRPIDINNPFPNGIADDSYWKLWEDDKKAGKEEPELEKSFNTITYMATDIDLNGIREYNNYNEYPDWTNLNIDGSSNFIKDYNFIARNSIINNNSFYSLGCGSFNQCPYYIDKNGVRKENPIYQPECSKVREGDVCP